MPQEGTSPQLNPRALGQWGDPGQAQGWEALAAGRGAGLGASPRLRAAPSRKHGGMHRPPVEWRILWGCPRTHMSPAPPAPRGTAASACSRPGVCSGTCPPLSRGLCRTDALATPRQPAEGGLDHQSWSHRSRHDPQPNPRAAAETIGPSHRIRSLLLRLTSKIICN